MFCKFITFQFYKVFITYASFERTVLDGFVQSFFKRLHVNFPALFVQQAFVQLPVEMLFLYFFLVQNFKYHTVNQYGFKYLGQVERQRIATLARRMQVT